MSKSKTQFTISIITPFLNEADGIELYFTRVIPALEKVTKNWEIICIDDGSSDDTLKRLTAFAKRDTRIKLIAFSRNFGKEAALTAGFDYATGDAVIPIDADLQDPPELIEKMVGKWKQGYLVVDAVRRVRADSVFKKLTASLFHWLIHFLTNGRIPAHVGDFRLIDRKALEAIKSMGERTRYIKGVVPWVGFKRTQIKYARPGRQVGDTKISFLKLFKLGCDAIFSFSSKPLKVWLYMGLMLSFISFVYACFLIGRTLMYGVDLPGYASIMVAILFMGGIQLISLGVIGEYIARIFKEVKNRPIYIVDETYGIEEKRSKTSKQTRKETSG